MSKERVVVFWECRQVGMSAMCLALRWPEAVLRLAMPSPYVECSAELNNKFVMLNLIRKKMCFYARRVKLLAQNLENKS